MTAETRTPCQHGRDPRACLSVHYTPAQAAAYVRAITASPSAKRASAGQPVPRELL